MLRLLVARLLGAIPLMFMVGTLVFFMMQLNPVDPTAFLLGDDTTDETVERAREDLGLNRPVLTQYGDWISSAAQGDLGVSWFNGEEVTTLLRQRASKTLTVALGSMLIAVTLGVTLGIFAAIKAGRWQDRLVTVVSSLGIAVPNFWVAIILAAVFAVKLRWFPAIWSSSRTETLWGWIYTIILPCVALGTAASAAIARQARSAMIGVLQQDYIRTALAKGLPVRRVIFKHAMRNAAIPVVTLMGFQLSALIGGSIFVEFIFNIPGLGTLGVQAVQRNNMPVTLGFVMVTTLVVVVANILLDMSYAWL
ncbi:MAG: ABC transporter permease, partial [Acidimicrobiaceae bacterium]|nr:ABC transporter permease [Acidimicrobiaceae bacterium]